MRVLSAELEELGTALGSFEDERRGCWTVTAYATDDTVDQVAGALDRACGSVAFSRCELPQTDWVTHSLTALAPVRAGDFLLHGSHDRCVRASGAIPIEIDAGQAFGTGHHGTTTGCLEAVTTLLKRRRPRRILDVGTGSGVLAIAVAKRTKLRVVASDIDPVAVRVAGENARRNGVGGLVRPITATGLAHPFIADAAPYDLIVANILARPLEKLAPAIQASLEPGGSVILSGLLARQRARVAAAYRAQGLTLRDMLVREGWATLTLG